MFANLQNIVCSNIGAINALNNQHQFIARFRYSFICQGLRYLNQETGKWPFRSSSQAATCYYQSNHSKVEAIPLRALPKDTTRELLAYLYTIPLMLNTAVISTFNVAVNIKQEALNINF